MTDPVFAFEEGLAAFLAIGERFPPVLREAVSYALNGGGKRVRPVLMFLTAEMLGVRWTECSSYALALEMIHTYSLIHDDLPAMDNDDFRRGKPTVHKQFGEGCAVLAGDGLLNLAHEILMTEAGKGGKYLKAAFRLAHNAGLTGMIAGQALEMQAEALQKTEGKEITREEMLEIYTLKTGKLLDAALYIPYLLSGADETVGKAVEKIAYNTGLIFQLTDDLLDFQNGTDADKRTFVTLFGEKEAKKQVEELEKELKDCFRQLPPAKERLLEYIVALTHRII